MHIHIIAVGKNRNGSLLDLYKEYDKRLSWTLSLHEIDPRKFNTNAREIEQIIKILPNDNSPIIALDETGKSIPSQKMAHNINDWQQQTGHIYFIIGGADGLNDILRKKSRFLLSFGQQTWPHMMVRVMLIEQIYRAQQILSGHPYHRQ